MKRYILFFISIGLILGLVLVYNITSVEKSRKTAFNESGYILNGSSQRVYFDQDETYTSTYDSKITFLDTEKSKVVVGTDNFIHYASGSICGLQDSVLLILSRIMEDPITYYNLNAKKEIKKVSNGYTLKNLKEDILFQQAICKISNNKYIILGNSLKIHLNSGKIRETSDYLEIEYFDNEIVNIYNQEVEIKTISSDSYIELENNIKIKLGSKIISKDDQNKLSLEDMVINSDDNVTLIDINENEDRKEEENTEENKTPEENTTVENNLTENNAKTSPTQAISTATTTNTDNNSSNNSTIIAGTQNANNINDKNNDTNTNSTSNTNNVNSGNNSENKNNENNISNSNNTSERNNTNSESTDKKQNAINIDTPEILYEYINGNESKVDNTVTLAEPSFKLQNMKITAVGVSGNIQIEDEDDVLSKDKNIKVKIINNSTGKIVYSIEEPYGTYNIPLNIETLIPNTEYSIIASASYEIDNQEYSKDFLNKAFVTSEIGIRAKKALATDESLGFNISFESKNIESIEVTLLDEEGKELANRKQTIKNANKDETIVFESLKSNTNYTMQISKIAYNGIVQEGNNWILKYEEKTLKQRPAINLLNYSLNKRDGTVTLYVKDIVDIDNSIQSYKYIVYKFTEVKDEEGKVTIGYDTENIAYEKEISENQITIEVNDEKSQKGIVRNQYYGFKVVAVSYDNEKYVETESDICGAFALNGVTFPVVRFERLKSETPATQIQGWLHIIDNDDTIIIDKDNPLTINYESDVDENKIYNRITSVDTIQRTTDDDGNRVLKIWVDLGEKGNNEKGLKEETTYNFSVYGTLDLKDGNDEYKNAYIGSCLVTTNEYDAITVNLKKTNVSSNSFTLELKLDGDKVSKESLSSLNVMLYEGSGDINQGEYKNWTRTITNKNYNSATNNAKYNTQINSLKDLLFDNTLIITPSFIGGGKESDYTELNYQVLVTATIDGTSYKNEIPVKMQEDDDDSTGNTYYKDEENKRTYSAAYMIVNGRGTTENVDDKKQVIVEGIKNSDATKYSLNVDENLDNNTFVGYQVDSNFINTATLTANEITYYVWDDEGNPVLDGKGEQLTQTLKITNQESIPKAVFELKRGSLNSKTEDNKNGLCRGNSYYFSYTIKYIDANGMDLNWPMCESDEKNTYTNQSLRSETILARKQEPRFVIYPKISDNNSITYKYSCSDYDKALEYEDLSKTDKAYLNLYNSNNENKDNIEIKTNGQFNEFVVSSLIKGETYIIKAKEKIDKGKETYTSKNLITQRFEGVEELNDVNIDKIEYGGEENVNKIKVLISGKNIDRIAAAELILDNGPSQITTELLKLNKNKDNQIYIEYDILNLIKHTNFKEFINKDIDVKVKAYYDSGIIGFETNNTCYVGYVNEENNYLTLDEEENKLIKADGLNGNLYKSSLNKEDTSAKITLSSINSINNSQNGLDINLLYSEQGFKQNGMIVVQTELHEKVISKVGSTVNIKPRLGIELEDITPTFVSANIKAKIINPLDIDIEKLTIEVWKSNKAGDTPKWNEAKEVEVNINEIGDYILKDLDASTYYYIRFKYKEELKDIYFYDISTKEAGRVYEFETIANFGIEEIEANYVANKYTEKYIHISYKIDSKKTDLFSKAKYTFFKEDGKTKVNLTQSNIVTSEDAEYEIKDGSLIVTKKGQELIEENVDISPNNNVFTMGEKYVLQITPIVTTQSGEERELESSTHKFDLARLKMPSIALKMRRNRSTSSEAYNYVSVIINIKDRKCSIYGEDWGQYNLHIYRYKDKEENKQELNYYSSINGGLNLKDSTFNLKNNAINYHVYLHKEDVDYSYNYVAELVFRYDSLNKGLENSREMITKYTLSAINNTEDLDIGTALISKANDNYELHLYETYGNINKINKIEYSTLKVFDGTIESGSFEPSWTLVNNDEDGISYYKTPYNIDFQANQVYIIKMNLYIGEELVGQIDMTYVKEE